MERFPLSPTERTEAEPRAPSEWPEWLDEDLQTIIEEERKCCGTPSSIIHAVRVESTEDHYTQQKDVALQQITSNYNSSCM